MQHAALCMSAVVHAPRARTGKSFRRERLLQTNHQSGCQPWVSGHAMCAVLMHTQAREGEPGGREALVQWRKWCQAQPLFQKPLVLSNAHPGGRGRARQEGGPGAAEQKVVPGCAGRPGGQWEQRQGQVRALAVAVRHCRAATATGCLRGGGRGSMRACVRAACAWGCSQA